MILGLERAVGHENSPPFFQNKKAPVKRLIYFENFNLFVNAF
jgi:hypothetical protein